MRLVKKLLLLALVAILVFYIFSSKSSQTISAQQQQLINLWGNPSQFLITYLPQQSDNASTLARYEVWYYPSQGKQVTFLSGQNVDQKDFSSDQNLPATAYLPWDFDIYTSLNQLKNLISPDQFELISLPAFDDDGVKTYATKDLLVLVEDDYVTYVQTFAYDDTISVDSQAPSPTPTPTSQSLDQKTYTSSDLGFSLNYPANWYLVSGVLANYDTDYLSKNQDPPQKMLKCDFTPYNPDQLKLDDLNLITDTDIKLYQTQIIQDSFEDDPGFADNVVFLIEDDLNHSMLLICYAYESDLSDQLINSLKTFKFIN